MPLRCKGTQFGNYLHAGWKSKPTFSQLMETFNFFLKSSLSAEDNENTAESEVRVFLGVLKYFLISSQTIIPLATLLMIIVCVMTKHTKSLP